MQVNYRINDRWRLTAGKKELSLGGYEFDYNPIQVIEYSDFIVQQKSDINLYRMMSDLL